MSDELSVSLDLNEEVRLFVRKRLRDFASENPQSKFNVLCWLDDLSVDIVAEIDDFLVEEDCHKRLKIGGLSVKRSVSKAEGYKTVVAPNPCPENKELLIIPDASHCDLYDGGYTEPAGKGEPKNLIPWDKLAEFFNKNLK